MTVQVLDESDVRRIAREEARRPEFVHQRNVEAVVGVPRRTYLRDARASAFPHTREARLILARTDDVVGFYELRIRVKAAPAANDANAETLEFARVGARRVAR